MDDTIDGLKNTIKRVSLQNTDMSNAEESIALTEIAQPFQSCMESQLVRKFNTTQMEHDPQIKDNYGDEYAFDHPSIYVDQHWIWII